MDTITYAKRNTRSIRTDDYGPFVVIKARVYRPAHLAAQHFTQLGPASIIEEMRSPSHEPGSTMAALQEQAVRQLEAIQEQIATAAQTPSVVQHQDTTGFDTPPSAGTVMLDQELWVWAADDPQNH